MVPSVASARRRAVTASFGWRAEPHELIELLRVFKLYWFGYNRVPPPCGEEFIAQSQVAVG